MIATASDPKRSSFRCCSGVSGTFLNGITRSCIIALDALNMRLSSVESMSMIIRRQKSPRIPTGKILRSAIGIIIYNQGFGYLQAYTAPLQMGFICVASILIGGATTTKATIMNVLIGTFLYQGLIIFTPPVSNHLLAGTDISDTMRQIIQNGVILYALAQAKGGSD